MKKATLNPERLFLDKWEMHKALDGERLHARLPETAQFSCESLHAMLSRFQRLYVKPIDTWGGAGIVVVERDASNGHLDAAGTITEASGRTVTYRTIEELSRVLEHHFRTPCIIQQAAPLVTLDDRPLDVRVLMQREPCDEWTYAGAVVRVGAAGGVVSNVAASGGYVLSVFSLLKQLRGHIPPKSGMIQSNFKQTGYAVARILDDYHGFDEIGLDLGIDVEGRLWIIEVNTNDALGGPSHELFKQLPDSTLYQQITDRFHARRCRDVSELFSLLFDVNPSDS